ncbi:MAG: GNAT family N-acetyltransferase [Bacteroidota bacterium]
MTEVVAVEQGELGEIAHLIARQYEDARAGSSVVPAALADPAAAETQLRRLLGAGHHGRVAVASGEPVGVLVGHAEGEVAELPAAGFALDPSLADPAQVLADLYGELAPDLLERGATRHYLSHLDTPGVLRAVSELGFGRISTCAIRPIEAPAPPRRRATDVVVREGTAGDLDTVVRLCREEIDHRYVPPIYTPRPTREPTTEELVESHRKLEVDGGAHLIASVEGTDVGVLTLEPTGAAPGLCPDDQPFIGETATVAGARGRGIGGALVEAAVGWAAGHGHAGVTVSFQPSSRVSRRFWLGAGFVPTGYWTVRRIPESYAARPEP